MLSVWAYSLFSVILVSLISLLGIFTLSLKPGFLNRIISLLVAFSVGALLGDAFIHLIPEAYKNIRQPAASLLVLSGIFLFFGLENFLRWRHCHATESSGRPHPVAALNLIGDAVHNFMDGLIIGASYLVSLPVGIATTVAVILHEIPQEISDFVILVHSGMRPPRALFFNFICALFAVIGAVLSLLIGPVLIGFADVVLPITAGGFIYVASADLIPELHHRCEVKASTSVWRFINVLLGVGVMVGLLFLG